MISYCAQRCILEFQTMLPKGVFSFFARKIHFPFSECPNWVFFVKDLPYISSVISSLRLYNYLESIPRVNTVLNGKWIFCAKKLKTSLGNIVCHSKMHPCAQYEIIWTNYAMNVAIRLIIWLESHESSHLIARLWEHFFKIIVVLQVCYFSWELGHI